MNAIHGWPSEIRPAGQSQANGDPGQWPPTTIDGQNLVRWNSGCSGWVAFSPQQKIDAVRRWWTGPDASLRSTGMDIAHPGWERAYIAQADAYCSRIAAGSSRFVFAPANETYPDLYLAQLLGRAGYNCAAFEDLPFAKKRSEVYSFLHTGKTVRERWAAGERSPFNYTVADIPGVYVQTDSVVHAIDAYCLKLAIQATNAPRTARPLVIRPAGQAVAVGVSVSGLLGLAVGVGVGYLAAKKHWF